MSVTCIERGTVLARLWSYVHAHKDGVDLMAKWCMLGPSVPTAYLAVFSTSLPLQKSVSRFTASLRRAVELILEDVFRISEADKQAALEAQYAGLVR